MDLSIEARRFKEIREELGITQSQFASELGIKSTTAEIERGRIRITGMVVVLLLEKYNINPLWLYGKSNKKLLNPKGADVIPQMVSVDNHGNENILLVNQKASAGYGSNIHDPEFYDQLPAFTFPLPEYRHTTFRGFQISGDSMTPLVENNDWVLAQAVERIEDIKDGETYIIVEKDSLRLKQIYKKGGQFELVSLNPEYAPITIEGENILELWKYHSKISTSTDIHKNTLDKIYKDIQLIKQRLK